MRNKESIEISKGYFEKLYDWAYTQSTPESLAWADTNPYWSTLSQGLATIAAMALSTYGLQSSIGLFTTAAIAPQLLLLDRPWNADDDGVPRPDLIPNDGGNLITLFLFPKAAIIWSVVGARFGTPAHNSQRLLSLRLLCRVGCKMHSLGLCSRGGT